jgi:S1-C subfamily serine protease
MKKTAYLWIAAAAFAGVFGALQAEKWIERRNSQNLPFLSERQVHPVDMESQTPAGSIDFRAASKKVTPSVVSVDRFERFQRGFWDDRVVETETGTGSGVILDTDGTIVTNNHVVAGSRRGEAPSKVRVRLSDGRSFDARVLGTDPRSDLAVLKIDAPNLKPIDLGSSKAVEVGQWVLAVGNPLGFDNTVSVGVVSSTKRNVEIGQGLIDGIQTDAAINPGNSGGALCDSTGRLIGINSAIASGTGMSVGIGFAIPVDRVKKVVSDIVKFGNAKYAGLGIQYKPELDGLLANPNFRRQVQEQFSTAEPPQAGVLILSPGPELTKAGAKAGSVIIAIDGTEVNGSFDLNKVLVPKKAGDTVTVKFWNNGETRSAQVKLIELEQPV